MSFLAIDIGNTHVKTGHFTQGRLDSVLQLRSTMTPVHYRRRVEQWLGKNGVTSLESVAIASVVKDFDAKVATAFSAVKKSGGGQLRPVTMITRDFAFPIRSAYAPGMLGVDRMLAAIAGSTLFGKPIVVVDVGSAATLDLVDHDGVFRGGLILAGAGLRVKALNMFTSLLPEIPLPEAPPSLIGTDTVGCLSSGIYHGMRAEIEGLVGQIQREVGTLAPVALTGRGSRLFHENLPQGWHVEEHLVLKGIYYSCQGTSDKRSKIRGQQLFTTGES